MQQDRKGLAETWLQTSAGDLRVAILLQKELPAASCFHSQQAAEKAVKAVLVIAAGDAPRVHALRSLLNELRLLEIDVPAEVIEHANHLDQFYMPTRYPDALGDIDPYSVYSEKQSFEAIEAAQSIIAWCKTTVGTASDNDHD